MFFFFLISMYNACLICLVGLLVNKESNWIFIESRLILFDMFFEFDTFFEYSHV